MKVYKKLLFYVPEKKFLVYLSVLFSVLSVFLTIGAYYNIHSFLHQLIVLEDVSSAKNDALLIVALLASSALVYFISVLFSHLLGFRLETNLRKRGIEGLADANFKFFDSHPSGKIRKIIDDNAAQTHMIVAHLIPDNFGAIFAPFLTLILGFAIDLKIGLLLLVLSILSAIAMWLMMGEQEFMKIYQESLERLSAETVEYIRGIQVVKIFGTDLKSFKALYNAINEYSQYALSYSMSCKKAYVAFQLLFFGMIAFILPVLILFLNFTQNPRLMAIHLIMALFLSGVLFSAIMKVMFVSMYSFQGKAAVDKLETLFADIDNHRLLTGTKECFKNFDIEFEDVSFGYTEDKMILKNLSFSLRQNRSYALVGASGSGKSTIAKLISGFYTVNSGHIKIGGENIEDYSETALSQNISFVFQDAKLFKRSIYENVKIAREDASDDEILNALHLAGCDSILDKFDTREHTMIGSKGVYLSGGEKQRIAIARAILRNAKIVILDEASASVDPENEHELQMAFSNLMKDKTVIMIAHRLSSIRNVDEIIVLEDGKIIERGDDKSLMQYDSKYKSLQELYTMANEWRVGYEK